MPLGMILFLSLQHSILPAAATAGNYTVFSGWDQPIIYSPVKKKVWSSGSTGLWNSKEKRQEIPAVFLWSIRI